MVEPMGAAVKRAPVPCGPATRFGPALRDRWRAGHGVRWPVPDDLSRPDPVPGQATFPPVTGHGGRATGRVRATSGTRVA